MMSIITTLLERHSSVKDPFILFVGGSMGAGKSTMVKQLTIDCLLLDPDQIKTMLPEWNTLWAEDPLTAGTKVHEQSTFILESVEHAALERNYNIIVDSSMRDHQFFKDLLESVHFTYPHYRIGFLYVQTDPLIARERALARTYQFVPVEIVNDSLVKSPICWQVLSCAGFEWLRVFRVNCNDEPMFLDGSFEELMNFCGQRQRQS